MARFHSMLFACALDIPPYRIQTSPLSILAKRFHPSFSMTHLHTCLCPDECWGTWHLLKCLSAAGCTVLVYIVRAQKCPTSYIMMYSVILKASACYTICIKSITSSKIIEQNSHLSKSSRTVTLHVHAYETRSHPALALPAARSDIYPCTCV